MPHPWLDPKAMLVDNKIYMTEAKSGIVVLDLAASRLSTVQLQQGVEPGLRNTMLSRADGGVALVYASSISKSLNFMAGSTRGMAVAGGHHFLREVCASLSISF